MTYKEIDARGLSCPEPVIRTQRALNDDPSGLDIIVDNRVAVENITRFCDHRQYQLTVDMKDEENYHLTIRK